MQKQYSISQAQRRFATVVQEAEESGPILIAQRGKIVAVLISLAEYERLAPNIFNVRDLSPGREVNSDEDQ